MFAVVVVLVACETVVLAGRREYRTRDALTVTARAPKVRVASEQRESVGVCDVIEIHTVGPREGGVALLAFG